MKAVLLLYTFALVTTSCALPFQDSMEEDPELIGGFYEGDMLQETVRNARRDEDAKWPNNTVYYHIDHHFDKAHRDYILLGMRKIEAVSCIRFKNAKSNQKYFVNITGGKIGCFSDVGFKNRVQRCNLQMQKLKTGCFRIGTIMHEFLHILGFYHMHSSYNRDDYIKIIMENVKEKERHNFIKYDEHQVDDFGEEYDYGSVMHYGADAFSKQRGKKKTIIPLKPLPPGVIMGQRKKMSKSDIIKLNKMYNCTNK